MIDPYCYRVRRSRGKPHAYRRSSGCFRSFFIYFDKRFMDHFIDKQPAAGIDARKIGTCAKGISHAEFG